VNPNESEQPACQAIGDDAVRPSIECLHARWSRIRRGQARSGWPEQTRTGFPVRQGGGGLDGLAEDLQKLRADCGVVSYADIVTRITKAREAAGIAPAAARIARTTVYDCFRAGRTRVNPELVGEIVQALTSDPAQAKQWVKRCQEARATGANPSTRQDGGRTQLWTLPDPLPRSFLFNALVTVAAVVLNLALFRLIEVLFGGRFPLYMDMIDVAVVAMVLGTRWGLVAAVLAQLLPLLYIPEAHWQFMFVGMAGALVWGLGVRQFKMAKTLPRYLLLNLVAGFVCTTVAVPVLVVLFGGNMEMTSAQAMAEEMARIVRSWVVAIFSVNLLISLADKLIAGLIALVVAGTVFKRYAPTDLVALTVLPSQRLQALGA